MFTRSYDNYSIEFELNDDEISCEVSNLYIFSKDERSVEIIIPGYVEDDFGELLLVTHISPYAILAPQFTSAVRTVTLGTYGLPIHLGFRAFYNLDFEAMLVRGELVADDGAFENCRGTVYIYDSTLPDIAPDEGCSVKFLTYDSRLSRPNTWRSLSRGDEYELIEEILDGQEERARRLIGTLPKVY